MTDFEDLLIEVRDWHLRVFGKPCNVKRTVLKLLEEASEAHCAARETGTGQGDIRFLNECVDVGLVLMSLLTPYLGSPDEHAVEEFYEGIRNKMMEVELRDQMKRDLERGIHG